MTKSDLQAIRRVLRYIATSDPNIQEEVLRLDAVLEKALRPATKENHTNGTHTRNRNAQ